MNIFIFIPTQSYNIIFHNCFQWRNAAHESQNRAQLPDPGTRFQFSLSGSKSSQAELTSNPTHITQWLYLPLCTSVSSSVKWANDMNFDGGLRRLEMCTVSVHTGTNNCCPSSLCVPSSLGSFPDHDKPPCCLLLNVRGCWRLRGPGTSACLCSSQLSWVQATLGRC